MHQKQETLKSNCIFWEFQRIKTVIKEEKDIARSTEDLFSSVFTIEDVREISTLG